MTTRTIQMPSSFGEVTVQVAEQGTGPNLLLLHGGGGPQTVASFGELLAGGSHVLMPTHPGFGGTPRPDAVRSPADLARLYVDLLDALDLDEVTVVTR